jgi:hypothetical protein
LVLALLAILANFVSSSVVLDDQLVIATEHPPAIQSVPWHNSATPYTDLIGKMDWIQSKSVVVHMVFDKPTNLFAWVTKDGKAYAVRKPVVTFFHSAMANAMTGWIQKGPEKLERVDIS